MAIDDLLDRWIVALQAQGVAPPTPPDDLTVLDEIDRSVLPLRLPEDLRHFYERIDVQTVHAMFRPYLSTLEFALGTLRQHRETPWTYPTALFEFCYESHNHVSIELDGPEDRDGGAVVHWSYGDLHYDVAHLSLRDWLDGWVALAEFRAGLGSPSALDRWASLIIAQSPHPVYGMAVPDRGHYDGPAFVFPMWVWGWPTRWRRLGGTEEWLARPGEDRSTISTLRLAAHVADGETVTATIAGTAGRYGRDGGAIVRVYDGGSWLTVACTDQMIAVIDDDPTTEYELDVRMRWDETARAIAARRERLSGRLVGPAEHRDKDALREDMELYQLSRSFSEAVAMAVRPLRRYLPNTTQS